MKHLLSIEDLDRPAIERILDRAKSFTEVSEREVKKVPALRGRRVLNLFYEASTRTRSSFELAAKTLSAEVINFVSSMWAAASIATSSIPSISSTLTLTLSPRAVGRFLPT